MKRPEILYYAKMANTTKQECKTPKFTVIQEKGFYPPMDELRSKAKDGGKGEIVMYLKESTSKETNAPSYNLQAKNSLNFTGLKDYFVNDKISGFAYGYPLSSTTYGVKKPRPNPFKDNTKDGFLFIITPKASSPEPEFIEVIVLENARPLIKAYCKELMIGGWNDELSTLRDQQNNM